MGTKLSACKKKPPGHVRSVRTPDNIERENGNTVTVNSERYVEMLRTSLQPELRKRPRGIDRQIVWFQTGQKGKSIPYTQWCTDPRLKSGGVAIFSKPESTPLVDIIHHPSATKKKPQPPSRYEHLSLYIECGRGEKWKIAMSSITPDRRPHLRGLWIKPREYHTSASYSLTSHIAPGNAKSSIKL
ncbi:hypothetical protein ANN_01033 [Periplaneta americana]|uniref:Uncharacterized protein n=1 Tax=Periplaneta americana TaxID=6978 RepID=A0ABQ8TVP9_PERAM|nr:hypothetical protein ANN_01033 [Periplaneta americana]